MHGVRLRVAYDGSGFVGWQSQPRFRTVQGELARVVSGVAGADVKIRGTSRTDSGVHAEDQVVAFDSPRALPMIGWMRALNGRLPPDIVVRAAEDCPVGYQPRYDAAWKRYRYLLHLGPVRDPQWRRRVWHLGPRRARPWHGKVPTAPEEWIDVDAMAEAASQFEGEHDFRAFRSAADIRENTVRTLTRVELKRAHAEREDLVAIEVTGTAFLQHMVRILVGTLVDVGRERMRPSDVAALLGPDASRDHAGETAPASGLTLVHIELGRERTAPWNE